MQVNRWVSVSIVCGLVIGLVSLPLIFEPLRLKLGMTLHANRALEVYAKNGAGRAGVIAGKPMAIRTLTYEQVSERVGSQRSVDSAAMRRRPTRYIVPIETAESHPRVVGSFVLDWVGPMPIALSGFEWDAAAVIEAQRYAAESGLVEPDYLLEVGERGMFQIGDAGFRWFVLPTDEGDRFVFAGPVTLGVIDSHGVGPDQLPQQQLLYSGDEVLEFHRVWARDASLPSQ